MRISDWSSDVCSSDLGLISMNFPRQIIARAAQQSVDRHLQMRGAIGVPDRIEHAQSLAHQDQRISALHPRIATIARSEEHTSEPQSLMRISYAVFCLKKKKKKHIYSNQPRSKYKKANTIKSEIPQTTKSTP